MFTKRIFSALTVIAMMAALATVTSAQSNESEAGASSRLEALQAKEAKQLRGTWALTITLTSGLPQLPPPFPGFITFTADGGLLVTFVPSPGTIQYPGQGEWIRTGNREFVLSFAGFQFDEKGNFLGTLKIRETFTLNEALDESTGQFTWEIAIPTGQVVASGDGTTRGTRIGIE